jgi:hypothetical protein
MITTHSVNIASPSELRIGNLVLVCDQITDIPNGIFIDEHWDVVSGIPLSPEILEGCGFIDPAKNGMGYRLSINAMDELCWYKQDAELRYQTRGSGFTRNFGVKYLHQLQNLFHSLVGIELTFKLEK